MDGYVSVVIPFYNDPYVGEAIESVLAQTYSPLEIIVVDDGSTRETDRLFPYEGLVRIVRQSNKGTAGALNAGFRAASGSYIAWLSSDDYFHPDKIRNQLRFMQEAGYAISHTAFWRMDEKGVVDKHPIILENASMLHFYRSLLVSNTVNGCTVMMTKAFYLRMGGFNELLPYTHDYDMWLRIVLAGFPIGYLKEPLTDYRIHPAMGTVKHREAIAQEIHSVQASYESRLRNLLKALER
ncbi:glycosyltransferase family 2 protein [Cohnella soli]